MTSTLARSTRLAFILLVALFGLACGTPTQPDAATDATPVDAHDAADGAMPCRSDNDCQDTVFCNGAERCAPADPSANARGCAPAATPSPCSGAQTCDEANRRCQTMCDVSGDADGDGHRAMNCGGDDCDDNDANRYPGRTEVCDTNNHDEDCDALTFGFRDNDNDGHADTACCNVDSSGTNHCGDDCNDNNRNIYPGLTEACNAIDDNCDGQIDEGIMRPTFYPDADGDGFGDMNASGVAACVAPAGTVSNHTDCDDTRAGRNPGLSEVCDLIGDNDCNPATHPFDADDDGFDRTSCGGNDCDDNQPATHPGATELCDRLDNDCSSSATGVDPSEDADNDGHAPMTATCSGGLPTDDCDDTRATVFTGAPELCDGLDSDCNGTIDDEPAASAACAPGGAGAVAGAAAAVCRSGSCAIFGCDATHANCDRNDANGCEVDTQSDANNCGGCGIACGAGNACSAGRCTAIVQVVTGNSHGCFLTASGRVYCWGASGHAGAVGARATQVPGITDAVEISAGGSHTCVRRSGGTLACWGTNGNGQLGDGTQINRDMPVAVMTITNAISIAAGGLHTCAALATGSVMCWGDNGNAQIGDGLNMTVVRTVPRPTAAFPASVVQLAAGANHTCARLVDGRVACWGDAHYGQIGAGGGTWQTVPRLTSTVADAVEVAAGGNESCARRMGGGVYCWGDNYYGQIGDGTMMNTRTTPVSVSGITDAISIGVGSLHACAARATGAVVCWGRNDRGQLGSGTTTDSSFPVAVLGGADVRTVDAGGGQSCALKTGSTILCWGDNGAGQLGVLGGGLGSSVPVPVDTTIPRTVQVVSGLLHTCARHDDGTVWCAGANASGQLGDGTTTDRLYPVQVGGITDALDLAAGENHTCARRAGGVISCWGANANGQLGDGTTTQRTSPVTVSGLTNVAMLTGARDFTCASLLDGTVRCWGAGSSPTPGVVTGAADVTYIAAGQSMVCVRRIGGSVVCWNGSLAFGSAMAGVSNSVGVAAGWTHRCSLDASGGVVCWGGNVYQELGNRGFTGTSSPTPLQVQTATSTALDRAVEIRSRFNHTCARQDNGDVYCWGGVTGTFPVDALGVATGQVYTCATRSGGPVACWGSNTRGQLGTGTTVDAAGPVGSTL